jgi:hypothetical protein
MVLTGLVATGLFACATAGSPALATASIAKPQLSPSLQSLAFYTGTWSCDGEQYNDSGTVTEKMKLGISVIPVIDNWLSVTVSESGKPITSELKGYNPVTKDFHHLWTAFDGTSGSFTSKGWDGDHLVFDEDHPAAAMKMRMTFTKIDDTHFAHNAEVDKNNAGFKLDFRKTCTKL